MTGPKRVFLLIALLLVPSLARAQPERSEVRPVLCEAMELAGDECAATTFERVGDLSLQFGRAAWVYVVVAGGPRECHIRHACFAIVARHRRRWAVQLSSLGQTVTAVPRRGHPDLIVTASNSSEQYDARRYRWQTGRYRVVERATCDHQSVPQRGGVCDAFRGSVPLQ